MRRLFLSHASADSALANRLSNDLVAAGFEVLLDSMKLKLGDDFIDFMNEAVEVSDIILILYSKNSAKALWQRREINAAVWMETAHGGPSVVVLRADDIRVPPLLGSKVYGDLWESSYAGTLKRLCAELFPTVTKASSIGEYSPPLKEWDEITTILEDHNRQILGSQTYAGYSPGLYFPRSQVFSALLEFIASEKVVMVLTGKAGTGKSFFIASLADAVLPATTLWLEDCSQIGFTSKRSLEEVLIDTRLLPLRAFSQLSQWLHDQNKAMLLVFDSLNEAPQREDFIIELARFVGSLPKGPIKILVTCRLPAWKVLRRHFVVPIKQEFVASNGDGFTLDIFARAEAEDAYGRYRLAYRLQTEYNQLSPQVRHFLSHPLFLKLTCESFEGRLIPPTLGLHDVFAAYVMKCLGENGLGSPEYAVLERAIVLMYRHARREIALDLLSDNDTIRPYVSSELNSPFSHLLDQGVLSQTSHRETLLRTTNVIFVTYERVFEFLLAEIIVGSATSEEIIRHLDYIRERAFLQLRGALELALSFALIKGTADVSLIIDLAAVDQSDSRQFLSDVIQTVFESGSGERSAEILAGLTQDTAQQSKLLAAQVAYRLGFDEILLELVLANDTLLRDRAALYLYERWNRHRRNGDLTEAYRPLDQLRARINLRRPRQSVRSLSALATLSINLGVHVVDDPAALVPLLNILQTLIRSVPGLAPDPSRGEFIRFLSEGTAKVVIETLAGVISRVMINPRMLKGIFKDDRAKRALLDVGGLITLGTLRGSEDKVLKLLRWHQPAIAFSARSVLTRHVYLDPGSHLPLLQNFLDDESLPLVVRINILHSMVFGTVARLMRRDQIRSETVLLFEDLLAELWLEAMDLWTMSRAPKEGAEILDGLRNILFGILFIEGTNQLTTGGATASMLWKKLFRHELPMLDVQVDIFLRALERLAFQGFVDLAVLSFINPSFLHLWEGYAPQTGYKALANLRVVFQQEVDALLENEQQLWDKIRMKGGTPNPSEIWEMSYSLWVMIGTAVNVTMMKLSGLLLLDLVRSRVPADFLRRAIRTLVAVLFEPDRIDIAHVQYGFAHDPSWDLFDVLEIPRSILLTKPQVHAYYEEISAKCVASLGRGVLYDEL